MKEFAYKGRYFNYYRKGYISSEYPYKDKFAKRFNAYLNSIANIIWGKDSSNMKELLNAPSSNEESISSNNEDIALASVQGN